MGRLHSAGQQRVLKIEQIRDSFRSLLSITTYQLFFGKRSSYFSIEMQRVIIRNQVLNWTLGEVAHIVLRVANGESVTVDWGDGYISKKMGQKANLDFRHEYAKRYKDLEQVLYIN